MRRRDFLKGTALFAAFPVRGMKLTQNSTAMRSKPVNCNQKRKYGCDNCFALTEAQIIELTAIWPYGFSGEICCKCERKVNILIGYPWFCCCGRFNCQDFSCDRPHERPDLGPSRLVISRSIRSKAAIEKRPWVPGQLVLYGLPGYHRIACCVFYQQLICQSRLNSK